MLRNFFAALTMFGYVITCNNTGRDKGFWSPFPAFIVWLRDKYVHWSPWPADPAKPMRVTWDWWSLRSELNFRKYGP